MWALRNTSSTVSFHSWSVSLPPVPCSLTRILTLGVMYSSQSVFPPSSQGYLPASLVSSGCEEGHHWHDILSDSHGHQRQLNEDIPQPKPLFFTSLAQWFPQPVPHYCWPFFWIDAWSTVPKLPKMDQSHPVLNDYNLIGIFCSTWEKGVSITIGGIVVQNIIHN